jgi:hypothetical protein
MGGSGDQVTAGGEGIGDGSVRSEKALSRAGRAEAQHLSLAQPDRDMRAFRSVVLALALDVLRAETHLAGRRAIGSQPIGHQFRWRHALLFQQLSHQTQRRGFVASALDQHVEDLALAVDRPPKVHLPASDRHEHLIQMPDIARSAAPPTQASGDQRAEARDPNTNRLVGDHDAALGKQLLDIAQAEGEAHIKPDRVLDDRFGEPEAAVEGRLHADRLAADDGSGKLDLTEPSRLGGLRLAPSSKRER